jgi:serine/threonine protein kinase
VLIDFGLSKESMESIIQMETYCGTPPYMAPEIFKQDYNEKVDVYALAVILH